MFPIVNKAYTVRRLVKPPRNPFQLSIPTSRLSENTPTTEAN